MFFYGQCCRLFSFGIGGIFLRKSSAFVGMSVFPLTDIAHMSSNIPSSRIKMASGSKKRRQICRHLEISYALWNATGTLARGCLTLNYCFYQNLTLETFPGLNVSSVMFKNLIVLTLTMLNTKTNCFFLTFGKLYRSDPPSTITGLPHVQLA